MADAFTVDMLSANSQSPDGALHMVANQENVLIVQNFNLQTPPGFPDPMGPPVEYGPVPTRAPMFTNQLMDAPDAPAAEISNWQGTSHLDAGITNVASGGISTQLAFGVQTQYNTPDRPTTTTSPAGLRPDQQRSVDPGLGGLHPPGKAGGFTVPKTVADVAITLATICTVCLGEPAIAVCPTCHKPKCAPCGGRLILPCLTCAQEEAERMAIESSKPTSRVDRILEELSRANSLVARLQERLNDELFENQSQNLDGFEEKIKSPEPPDLMNFHTPQSGIHGLDQVFPEFDPVPAMPKFGGKGSSGKDYLSLIHI